MLTVLNKKLYGQGCSLEVQQRSLQPDPSPKAQSTRCASNMAQTCGGSPEHPAAQHSPCCLHMTSLRVQQQSSPWMTKLNRSSGKPLHSPS